MRADQSGMGQMLVSDMGASVNAGKTKFNISGKAIADDGVGTELAFMLARAMINEDTGDSKNQMMDALNQMSKSDEGINTVKKVTKNMARKIWMSVMRTMAGALCYQRTSRKLKLKPRPKESASLATSGGWGRRRTKRGPHVATTTARSSAQVVSGLRIHAQSARRVLLNLSNRLRRRTSDNARNHHAHKREEP